MAKYQLQPAHHYCSVLTSYAINRYYVITQQSHWPEPQQRAYRRCHNASRCQTSVGRRPCKDVWWKRQREDVVWRHLRAEDCGVSPRRPRGDVCVHVWVETWRKQFGDSLEIDLERGLPETAITAKATKLSGLP